ncbi:MAG: hypothetical protein IJQ58_11340 [Synergistaceae bacterium]|nr:hypothetical protein [Synergistaceae bacterium]
MIWLKIGVIILEILILIGEGMPRKEAISEMARKYDLSPQTLERYVPR